MTTISNPINPILSVLLSVMLMFGAVSGSLTGLDVPVDVEAQATLDAGQVSAMLDEYAAAAAEEDSPVDQKKTEQYKRIAALLEQALNVVSFKSGADHGVFALSVDTDDSVLLNTVLRSDDNGVTLESSMLPQTLIGLSANETEAALATYDRESRSYKLIRLLQALSQLDRDLVRDDRLGYREQFQNGILQYAEDEEQGEFAVDGYTFTVKRPVVLTDVELFELAMDTLRDYMNVDSLQTVLVAAGLSDEPLDRMEKELTDLRELPEEEHFKTDMAIYSAENGDRYIVVDLDRDSNEEGRAATKALFRMGAVAGKTILRAEIVTNDVRSNYLAASFAENGNFELELELQNDIRLSAARDDNRDFSGALTAQLNGRMVTVSADTVHMDDGIAFAVNVHLDGEMDPLFEVHGTARQGQPIAAEQPQDKKTADIVQLVNNEAYDDAVDIQVQLGGSALLATMELISELPEEAAADVRDSMLEAIGPVLRVD